MPDPRCRIGRVKPKGNVRLFPGVKGLDVPVNRQPHSATIALLRDALAKAERGEICGVAVACMLDTGFSMHNWAGADHLPASGLIGALMLLAQDIGDATMHRKPSYVDYDK